jgi:hypothetical protein
LKIETLNKTLIHLKTLNSTKKGALPFDFFPQIETDARAMRATTTTTPTRRRRRCRRSTTKTTILIALLFTAMMSLFSTTVPRAEAIKHKKKDVVDDASSAPEEEPAQHQLDPALNTDEVRDAAKQVAHITDMDAYLAAIEHKMDVLAEHPAHNVRLFVCFLFFLSPLCFGKTGTRGRSGRIRGDDASPPVSLRRLFFSNERSSECWGV